MHDLYMYMYSVCLIVLTNFFLSVHSFVSFFTSSYFFSCSNFLIRSMPIPVHDLAKVVNKEGVEEAVARIQCYLCRNHSDERFGIELAKRHQHRLLLASQQSVSTVYTVHCTCIVCTCTCVYMLHGDQ